MTQATSFGPVAPFYDDLMKVVPYRMWVGYYLLLLSQIDAHPRRMLDVCCGTGAMCQLLTQEGFELTGFDLSPDMIRIAQAKARKKLLKIRYEVADAADFDLGDTFPAAFSFFDSLNNIVEPDRFRSAMRCVARHLEPGGSFIFDLNTAYAFEQRMFDQQETGDRSKLRYKWVGDWDAGTRVITVHMTFWHEDQEFEETHVQRAYSDAEVREAMEAAGFGDVHAYASYTLDPPKAKSDRVHYVCIKRG